MLKPSHRSKLVDILIKRFSLDELEELCFLLDIDYENLAGPGIRLKSRELVSYLERSGRIPALIDIGKQQQPLEAGWEDILGIGWKVPVYRTCLAAFYVGKHPVTNIDYKKYMDDVGRTFEIPEGKEYHPVVDVPWFSAVEYATWAGMRLLSEEEWEKAASWNPSDGGRKYKYAWGNEFDKSKCNTEESEIEDTTPVGHYSPEGDSPYGCADMVGNVWEWTASRRENRTPQTAGSAEDLSSVRSAVLRGGAFTSTSSFCRSASRYEEYPYTQDKDKGFRMGLSVPSSSSTPLEYEEG